jgi:RimJ/RimL family protein N-acetyltransferase
MNAPIEFDTQRLLLRQWKAADREPFAALNADPIVMAQRWPRAVGQFFGFPK